MKTIYLKLFNWASTDKKNVSFRAAENTELIGIERVRYLRIFGENLSWRNKRITVGGIMDRILINIKDKSKAHVVVDLLKELSFIEFRELDKANKMGKASDFRKLYGIWKGREVTLDDLRQTAWQRKTS
jgi:hypothetical protein